MKLNKLKNNLFLPNYNYNSVTFLHNSIKKYFGINSHEKNIIDLNVPKIYKNIVLFVLDGFGENLLNEHKEEKNLKKIIDVAKIASLSTIFPSATAPYMTFINTGMMPFESGIVEYNSFINNENIEVLPYKVLGYENKDFEIYDDKKIFWKYRNFYDDLEFSNINSNILTPIYLAESRWTNVTKGKNTNVFGYSDLENGFERLNSILKNTNQYTFFYYPDIDDKSHQFGLKSVEVKDSVNNFWDVLYNSDLYKNKSKDTLFLFTADHGHIDNSEETIYLNDIIDNFETFLDLNFNGEVILPCGSFRDLFLFIKSSEIGYIYNELKEKLREHSIVLTIKECFDIGLFGRAEYNTDFRIRFGDIVILPFPKKSIWFKHERLNYSEIGSHGGLSKDELLVPLIALL